jgi:poly(3-hydroxyoctanoate) depolymerase
VTTLDAQLRDSLVTLTSGVSVYVRVQGEGEPLLLLNGFSRSLDSWGPFVDALDGRTIISFDAPGTGESPAPRLPLSIPQLADVAASVLEHLGIERADVLGFSYGGAVAQQMAASHAERVHRLVLVSTSCGLGTTLGPIDAPDQAALDAAKTTWPNAVGALWSYVALASWSSISFLGSIASPTLIVCGRDDRVAPPANSRSLAQRIPDASLVMLDGGHDLQSADAATHLASTVVRFLRSSTPISTATDDVA